MDSIRYIGLDLHRDTISAAVLDKDGTLMSQSVLATRAAAILDFLHGIRGTLHVTFEECCHSAWLYDLLNSRVAKLVVCNPRKNSLLKFGSKSDAIDARKLAELLRAGMLAPVYHGENSVLEVQHLARCYDMLTDDTTRVMSRLKAVFRSQAVACTGKRLYGSKHRDSYLKELNDGAHRRRAEYLYRELEVLQKLRREARHELMAACRKHPAAEWLQSVPYLRPLRTAILLGRVKTPFRFRTKRQFWAYCGLAVETRDSGEYRVIEGQIERRKRSGLVRGLNQNHNHDLKNLFKGAATTASLQMQRNRIQEQKTVMILQSLTIVDRIDSLRHRASPQRTRAGCRKSILPLQHYQKSFFLTSPLIEHSHNPDCGGRISLLNSTPSTLT